MEFFTNSRIPAVPTTRNRVGSSSQVATRSSAVDFDKVPSPRPRTSLAASKRHSMTNGTVPGPSNLSKSTVPEPDTSPDHVQANESGLGDSFNDYGPPDTPTRNSSPQHTSFLQMDQDDGDDVDDEHGMEESPVQTAKNRKGKERAKESEQNLQEDHDVEEEIAQGLEEVELGNHSDEGEAPPPNKKARTANDKPNVQRNKKVARRSRTFFIYFFLRK